MMLQGLVQASLAIPPWEKLRSMRRGGKKLISKDEYVVISKSRPGLKDRAQARPGRLGPAIFQGRDFMGGLGPSQPGSGPGRGLVVVNQNK